MPTTKHRRRGQMRPRDRNQEPDGVKLTPEFEAELRLVRDFLRQQHGDRLPSHADLPDAVHNLSERLPLTGRLLHELDHNDPDGTLERVLLAVAGV